MMRIYSIRERPEYIPAMLESLENHWPACMPWIQKHMEQVRQTDAPLPDAYIAVEKGKVVGGYTLAVKEILWSEDKGPDACAWGEPTRMFENTTLPPKVRRIA